MGFLAPHSVTDFAINSTGDFFIGGWWGVAMSSDSGKTWQTITIDGELPGGTIRFMMITPDEDLFVGRTDGLWYSRNNGQTWTHGLTDADIWAIARDSNGDLYTTTKGGIYRSQNEGENWGIISTGLPDTLIYDITLDGVGNLGAATAGGVFRSTDGGFSWAKSNNGLESQFVYEMNWGLVVVIAISDAGVFRSTDHGDSWQPSNSGLIATSINKLLSTTDNELLATSESGFFYSNDNGDNWQLRTEGLQDWNVHAIAVTEDLEMFIGTGAGVFYSEDKGQSWLNRNDGLNSISINSLIVNANSDLFAGTKEGLFYSSNKGETWIPRNNGLTLQRNRALTTNSAGELFAAMSLGQTAGIFRSVDNGETWSEINNGLPTASGFNTLESSPTGVLFTSNYEGTFRSKNNGDAWSKISDFETSDFLFDDGKIYAAVPFEGVRLSMDYGDTWENVIARPDSNTWLTSLAFDSGGHLLGGTAGVGVFRSNSKVTSVNETEFLPKNFVLEQNYPNPFNPTTEIRFFIPATASVSLKIYNLKGNLIRTVVSEIMRKGSYTVEWDGIDESHEAVASGIYFYELKTGTFSQVKKMSLIK